MNHRLQLDLRKERERDEAAHQADGLQGVLPLLVAFPESDNPGEALLLHHKPRPISFGAGEYKLLPAENSDSEGNRAMCD